MPMFGYGEAFHQFTVKQLQQLVMLASKKVATRKILGKKNTGETAA